MWEIFESVIREKGLSVADVSRGTGINQSTFSNWKERRNLITGENAIKICNFLDISIDYLMTGNRIERSSISGKKYYFSDETAEMAQEMFESKELRALYDVQRDMEDDDLKAMYNMAVALKRKERGTNETGC